MNTHELMCLYLKDAHNALKSARANLDIAQSSFGDAALYAENSGLYAGFMDEAYQLMLVIDSLLFHSGTALKEALGDI